MKFSTPLIFGTLIKRYKRFLADIELETGEIVTAHCANPGTMLGLKAAGSCVAIERSTNPARKLKYSWRLIKDQAAWVGIDTSLPNKIISEALTYKTIAELAKYDTIRAEVKYHANSRIDFLLTQDDLPDCYVEVKNVHLCRVQGLVEFPDSVTTRGTKHLDALENMVQQGHRAVMLYCVQRMDCTQMKIAEDIDTNYAKAFSQAKKRGVEMLAYTCKVTTDGIDIAHAIPIVYNS